MKKIFIVISFFFVCTAQAQVMPTYTPISYDQYVQPFQGYARQYKLAEAQIIYMKQIVLDALEQGVDEILERELKSDYSRLSSLHKKLQRDGLSREIWNEIIDINKTMYNQAVRYHERSNKVYY